MLDVALPWCGAFRTTSRPGSRRGRIARSPSLPMSPGSTIETLAQPHLEHDRVLVPHALALPVGRRRMQHAQLDVAEALDVAGLHACAS